MPHLPCPDLRRIWPACLLLLCLLPLGAQAAPLCDMFIQRTVVDAARNRVVLQYGLALKPLAPLKDQLRDGAHMMVEGHITLWQLHSLTPNDKLTTVSVEWHIRHDPLTREFVVLPPDGQARRGQQLEGLLAECWNTVHTELVPDAQLEDGSTYRVDIEMVLKHAQMPPWLEKTLLFWSWNVSDPLTVEHEFAY